MREDRAAARGVAAVRSRRVFNSECRRAEYSRSAINIHENTVAVASPLQNIFQYTGRAGRGDVNFARYCKSMATAARAPLAPLQWALNEGNLNKLGHIRSGAGGARRAARGPINYFLRRDLRSPPSLNVVINQVFSRGRR